MIDDMSIRYCCSVAQTISHGFKNTQLGDLKKNFGINIKKIHLAIHTWL